QDLHHQTARALVRAKEAIEQADVQPANRGKPHQRAKSLGDAGWSALLALLSGTAAGAGRSVSAVPSASTRQTCSGGGVLVHQGLSLRWPAGPECGTRRHRDQNAAKNRERAGQARRGGVAVVASGNRASIGLEPVWSVKSCISFLYFSAVTGWELL